MHSQYKYKGDNPYLSFHERLCRFNQKKINGIIESAFPRADSNRLWTIKLLSTQSKFINWCFIRKRLIYVA